MSGSGESTSDQSVRLVTIQQAATILGCSRANVYGLVQAGEIPVIAVGKSRGYRIDHRDLEEFVQRRKVCKADGKPPRPAPRQRLKHIKL